MQMPELHLHHPCSCIGNHGALRRSLGLLQAKLTIGAPGDIYEQEADRVAEQVMRMPEPGSKQKADATTSAPDIYVQQLCPTCDEELRRQPVDEEEDEETVQTLPLADQITPLIQRQVEPAEEEEEATPVQPKLLNDVHVQRQKAEPEEEEEEEPLQTKAFHGSTSVVTPAVHAKISALRGGGQPLPASTRAFFEPRFGCDFSRVRVHADDRAAETAHALNARAFTVGHDVVFGRGQYAQGTVDGGRLLAHELTHVLQQEKGLSPGSLPPSRKVMRVPETAEPQTPSLPNWSSPVRGSVVIGQGWGARRGYRREKGKEGVHHGIDIMVPEGTPVLAIGNGLVTFVYEWTPGGNTARDRAGNFVQIRHANGFKSEYMHLSEISVTKGQRVTGGDVIGRVGRTGGRRAKNPNAKPMAPHLHLQMLNRSYEAVPAEPYVKVGGTVGAGVPLITAPAPGPLKPGPMERRPLSIKTSGAREAWLDRAVRRNAVLSATLGWGARVDDIVLHFQALGYLRPLETPDAEHFAGAVRRYQRKHVSLGRDGILGTRTWQQLEPELKRAPIFPLPSVTSQLPAAAISSRAPGVKAKLYEVLRQPKYEGTVPNMYLDRKGLVTIGIGFLIDPLPSNLPLIRKADNKVASRAEIEIEYKTVRAAKKLKGYSGRFGAITTLKLTSESMKAIFDRKVDSFERQILHEFPDYGSWPEDAQIGLLSMVYALGIGGVVKKFKEFTAALKRKDFQTAAEQCHIRTPRPYRNAFNKECFEKAAQASGR